MLEAKSVSIDDFNKANQLWTSVAKKTLKEGWKKIRVLALDKFFSTVNCEANTQKMAYLKFATDFNLFKEHLSWGLGDTKSVKAIKAQYDVAFSANRLFGSTVVQSQGAQDAQPQNKDRKVLK